MIIINIILIIRRISDNKLIFLNVMATAKSSIDGSSLKKNYFCYLFIIACSITKWSEYSMDVSLTFNNN
jgi:hypothetical protein